jgi:S-adenosylmethionine synthetase
MSQEVYEIDEETKEMCEALDYYDAHGHFPFEKKKILITISRKSYDKLKSVDNRSKEIDNLIFNRQSLT